MGEKLTKAETAIADRLRGKEALRQGPYFSANGFNIGETRHIEKMASKGAVRIETIGESVFATLADPPLPEGAAP